MKRTILLAVALFLFLNLNAAAFDTSLLEMRDNFFSEARLLKAQLANSKDAVLVVSMWDSSIMATSQLNAYFHMVGIFDGIKDKDLTQDSINFLVSWLNEIKRTSDQQIKSLDTISTPIEPSTQVHVVRLRQYFSDVNDRIDNELNRIDALSKKVSK